MNSDNSDDDDYQAINQQAFRDVNEMNDDDDDDDDFDLSADQDLDKIEYKLSRIEAKLVSMLAKLKKNSRKDIVQRASHELDDLENQVNTLETQYENAMAVIDVHDPTMAGDEFRAGFSSDFGTVKSLLDAVLALITEGVEHMDFTYGAQGKTSDEVQEEWFGDDGQYNALEQQTRKMMSHYKGLYKNKDGPQAAVTHKPFKNVVNTMHHLGNKWDRLLELDRDRPDSGPVAFERQMGPLSHQIRGILQHRQNELDILMEVGRDVNVEASLRQANANASLGYQMSQANTAIDQNPKMGSYVNQALRGNNNRAPIDDDDDDVIPHMNGTRPLRSTTVPSRQVVVPPLIPRDRRRDQYLSKATGKRGPPNNIDFNIDSDDDAQDPTQNWKRQGNAMIKQMELERVTENSKASRETDDWKLVKRILGEMPYKYADQGKVVRKVIDRLKSIPYLPQHQSARSRVTQALTEYRQAREEKKKEEQKVYASNGGVAARFGGRQGVVNQQEEQKQEEVKNGGRSQPGRYPHAASDALQAWIASESANISGGQRLRPEYQRNPDPIPAIQPVARRPQTQADRFKDDSIETVDPDKHERRNPINSQKLMHQIPGVSRWIRHPGHIDGGTGVTGARIRDSLGALSNIASNAYNLAIETGHFNTQIYTNPSDEHPQGQPVSFYMNNNVNLQRALTLIRTLGENPTLTQGQVTKASNMMYDFMLSNAPENQHEVDIHSHLQGVQSEEQVIAMFIQKFSNLILNASQVPESSQGYLDVRSHLNGIADLDLGNWYSFYNQADAVRRLQSAFDFDPEVRIQTHPRTGKYETTGKGFHRFPMDIKQEYILEHDSSISAYSDFYRKIDSFEHSGRSSLFSDASQRDSPDNHYLFEKLYPRNYKDNDRFPAAAMQQAIPDYWRYWTKQRKDQEREDEIANTSAGRLAIEQNDNRILGERAEAKKKREDHANELIRQRGIIAAGGHVNPYFIQNANPNIRSAEEQKEIDALPAINTSINDKLNNTEEENRQQALKKQRWALIKKGMDRAGMAA